MKSRAQELRRKHRRILIGAFGVAIVLHVAGFFLLGGIRTEPELVFEPELEGIPAVGGAMVDVRFGPPFITLPDGTVEREPPERTLQVVRLVRLPLECTVLRDQRETMLSGSVRLRVGAQGLVEASELASSTGSPCADELMTGLADDLWYRWLPNERHPAPVELVQPVTLLEVVE